MHDMLSRKYNDKVDKLVWERGGGGGGEREQEIVHRLQHYEAVVGLEHAT